MRTVLADPRPELDRPLPDWAIVLREISTAARSFNPAAMDHSPVDPHRPVPFEDLLLPALFVARERLCARLGLQATPLTYPPSVMVSADAYQALERGLLRQLGTLSGQTLESDFWQGLPYGHSLLVRLGVDGAEIAGDKRYRRFVRRHLRSGLRDLFDRHPVLGRLMATAVTFWVEATAEFLQRVGSDHRDLMARFGLRGPTPKIARIELFLSDPHRRGRSVLIVEFACGQKVVYKPKALGLEAAFNRLLTWFNQRSAFADLRVTAVLDRGDYGWVEYLQQMPCADEEAARRFYRRAGMLLCLLNVVRATDCHHENLIAHGEHLVLVDAETLMSHEPQPLEDSQLAEAGVSHAERQFGDSVLRTGLLPRWQFNGDDGAAYDVSGLGGTTAEARSGQVLRWHGMNTDAMHAGYETVAVEAQKNVPHLDGTALSPLDYQVELTSGFEQMYRFIVAHLEALAAADGPLAAMRTQSVRFIFRATRVYGNVSVASWTPDILSSGIEYGIHLEQLARGFLAAPTKPNAWPVFAAEIRAMEQMDIPVFFARANDTALDVGDGATIPGAIQRPSYDKMIELLVTMGETDLERQLAIIQGALHAKAAQSDTGKTVSASLPDIYAPRSLGRDDFVREAIAIGVEIERRALADGKDGANWIGLGYIEHADRFQLQVLDDNLYDGCAGVSLFLAALSAVTGERRFGTLALRGLDGSRRRLRAINPSSRDMIARLRRIGGAIGLGSMIYGLVRTAALLDEDELLEEAAALAEWLTPNVIAGDRNLDVMSGAAGALLSLLSLHSSGGSADVLAKAVACGDHLLLRRVESNGGLRVWQTIGGRPLTGFSHGAAGIAYALTRLYGVTGNRVYLEAASDGIEFERSVFSETRGNWPDLREAATNGKTHFPVKWCHGAAGIALARLGSKQIAAFAGIEREIEIALRTTREYYLQETDFVCCGNFGRVETFLVAARVTGQSEWRRLAETGAAAVLKRAHQSGHYRLFVDVPGIYNPGFFQGMAGIGYQLLRLAHDGLPSVLIWE